MKRQGSARWLGHRKKATVEECRTISIGSLVHERGLGAHVSMRLKQAWPTGPEGCQTASVDIELETGAERGLMRLDYHAFVGGESAGQMVEVVRLQASFPHWGGLRWWFECPECGRRVTKLHLPPNGDPFRCRLCHDLTYESSRRHNAPGVNRRWRE
jgi:hypothetical protein